jgi:hypothetical protein
MSTKYFTKFKYLYSEKQDISSSQMISLSLDELLDMNRKELRQIIFQFKDGEELKFVQLKVNMYNK